MRKRMLRQPTHKEAGKEGHNALNPDSFVGLGRLIDPSPGQGTNPIVVRKKRIKSIKPNL